MDRPLKQAEATTEGAERRASAAPPAADRVADSATAEPRWRLPTDPPPA